MTVTKPQPISLSNDELEPHQSTGIPVSRHFSISDIWTRNNDGDTPGPQQMPPIPSIISPTGEVYYATPLPKISMMVLSITMLSEFLSANVSAPWILFMVKGFDIFSDDAQVAFWTGILVSLFFLTQFFTSLIWTSIAERYSPRAAIIASLVGSAISTLIFGTTRNLPMAIIVRLAQGAFAGAIGVAKGSVSVVTDSTNEGRAYAILGFCWGFGGISGAVIGGAFEHPVTKWPTIFPEFFDEYPYFLPCFIVSLVLLSGSILACFLGPDLGPRCDIPYPNAEKATACVPTQTEHHSGFTTPTKRPDSRTHLLHRSSVQPIPSYGVSLSRHGTMESATNAYAYGSMERASARDATISGIQSRRRSINQNIRPPTSSWVESERVGGGGRSLKHQGSDGSLVHRMILANENNVGGGISDLWVSAAINMDMDDDENEEMAVVDDDECEYFSDERRGRGSIRGRRFSIPTSNFSSSYSRSTSRAPRFPTSALGFPRSDTIESTNLSLSRGQIGGFFPRSDTIDSTISLTRPSLLPPIIESRIVSSFAVPQFETIEAESSFVDDENELEESQENGSCQLPFLVIALYGLLALHTTIHDQVFMSYLVTPYEAGGLNLNAGDFAQLIALMGLLQMVYQFYFYPTIGPPRGPFSHLAMFRIACILFVPAYFSVTLYRVFASPDGHNNAMLMLALTGSTAIRFCGNTFGFTSISILLNYMAPPPVVGYANGIAQSIVSLARFLGPVIGGWLWSISTEGGPSNYYVGFVVCAVASTLVLAFSMMVR